MTKRVIETLVTELTADGANFKKELKETFADAKKWGEDLSGIVSSAATSIGGIVGGISVGAVLSRVVTETRNAADEQAQLAAVLKSTGASAGYTQDQLNSMADAMESISTFSAGDINTAQTAMLEFTNIVGEQFPRAMDAAADMAARRGMDIKSAAETVGRALDVPSQGMSALSRQGFRFSDSQKALVKRLEETGKTAEAQKIILDALEGTYGGAAEAAKNTLGGALLSLENIISGKLTAEDGLPGLTNYINLLGEALQSEDFAAGVDLIVDAATVLTTLVGVRLTASMTTSTAAFIAARLENARYQATLASMAGVSQAAALSQTALATSTRAAGLAMGLLGGPTGVAILAGTGLVYLATRSSDAEERLENLRTAAQNATEDIKKMGEANRTLEMSRLTKELKESEAQLKELQDFIASADAGRTFTSLEYYQQVAADIENLDGHIEGLNKSLTDLSGAPVAQLKEVFSEYNNANIEEFFADKIDEQIKDVAKLNDAYETRIETLKRANAVSEKATELEKVRYDFTNGALKGISPLQAKRLEDLAKERDLQISLVEEEKKRTEHQKELAADLKSVLQDLMTDEERYQALINERTKIINEAKELGLLNEQEYREAVVDMEKLHQKELKDIKDKAALEESQRQQLQLAAAENLFGSLADITKKFAGENSRIYKAMFLTEKLISIGRSMLAIKTGIALAAANPFPKNMAAMATVAVATGGLLADIDSINVAGIAHGGLDNVPKEATYLLDKGERVVSPMQNRDLTSFLRSASTGGPVNIQIINAATNQPISAEASMINEDTLRIVLKAVDRQLRDDLGNGRGVFRQMESRYGLAVKGAY